MVGAINIVLARFLEVEQLLVPFHLSLTYCHLQRLVSHWIVEIMSRHLHVEVGIKSLHFQLVFLDFLRIYSLGFCFIALLVSESLNFMGLG